MLGAICYLMYLPEPKAHTKNSSWINLTLSDKTFSTYANLRCYDTACTILLLKKKDKLHRDKENQKISRIYTISQTL